MGEDLKVSDSQFSCLQRVESTVSLPQFWELGIFSLSLSASLSGPTQAPKPRKTASWKVLPVTQMRKPKCGYRRQPDTATCSQKQIAAVAHWSVLFCLFSYRQMSFLSAPSLCKWGRWQKWQTHCSESRERVQTTNHGGLVAVGGWEAIQGQLANWINCEIKKKWGASNAHDSVNKMDQMTLTLRISLLHPLGLMTCVSSFKEASSHPPLNTQAGEMSCSALGLLLLLVLTYAVTESSILGLSS